MCRLHLVVPADFLQLRDGVIRHLAHLTRVRAEDQIADFPAGSTVDAREDSSRGGVNSPIVVEVAEGVFCGQFDQAGHGVIGYQDGAMGTAEDEEVERSGHHENLKSNNTNK